jgi:hypothetical protein
MDAVTGEWRKVHNEELTKHYSGDQTKKNEMGGAPSRYGGEEWSIKGFGGET